MSPESSFERQAEATRWLVAMDKAGWDAESEQALQAWLCGDARRRGAFLRAQATWLALGGSEADEVAEAVHGPQQAAPALPSHGRRRFVLGFGAALAASVAGGLFLLGGPASYETQVGEIRSVPLADGSIATINTGSIVKIEFAETKRAARIERGEAWFQIAKDKSRPFIVEAGPVRVQAVGTAFSVRRRDPAEAEAGGVEVLVTEGVVEAWIEGATGKRLRLAAGSRAFLADDPAVGHVASAPAEVDRALAWRSGKVDLVAQPVGLAAAEFNRYNKRKIVITDPDIALEEIDGIFSAYDPDGFALALSGSMNVAIDTSDPRQIRVGGRRAR